MLIPRTVTFNYPFKYITYLDRLTICSLIIMFNNNSVLVLPPVTGVMRDGLLSDPRIKAIFFIKSVKYRIK